MEESIELSEEELRLGEEYIDSPFIKWLKGEE